jgi:hypothetical protein
MKLELYLVPEEVHGKAIKIFLEKSNLPFKEIITNDLFLLNKIAQTGLTEKISLLRVTFSHSIQVYTGFNEHSLNHLLEHIKRYNPRLEN